MADPTIYDLIQDGRIQGLEGLVTPSYTPPQDQEHSFPVVGQGIDSQQFQQISRAAGTGVYVQHDAEGAQAPYRLTGLPGGDSETNAKNQMMLRTSNVTGRSEAVINGFFHTQLVDKAIDLPAVSTPTTYHVCITLDPRKEDEPAGPVRIETYAGVPPTANNRQHIVLWTVHREPNQLLTQATIQQHNPWLGHVINVWSKSNLPVATSVEYGTLAVVVNPSAGDHPELFTNRGVWGWVPIVENNAWQDLPLFAGWHATYSRFQVTREGVRVAVFAEKVGTQNANRLFQLPPQNAVSTIFRSPLTTSDTRGSRYITIESREGFIDSVGIGDRNSVSFHAFIPDFIF